jgi:hypothetical protein
MYPNRESMNSLGSEKWNGVSKLERLIWSGNIEKSIASGNSVFKRWKDQYGINAAVHYRLSALWGCVALFPCLTSQIVSLTVPKYAVALPLLYVGLFFVLLSMVRVATGSSRKRVTSH